jgi:hypothetical protein
MPDPNRWANTLEVLACDIAARPPAPGIDDLAPFIRGVTRQTNAITVAFDPSVAGPLSQFVEAERLCCAGLGWDIDATDGLALRITATPEQLDHLEAMFAPA